MENITKVRNLNRLRLDVDVPQLRAETIHSLSPRSVPSPLKSVLSKFVPDSPSPKLRDTALK